VAKRLREFKDKTGYSVRQIAQFLGKSAAWVERHIRMLDLEKVFPRGNTQLLNKISEHHARVILQQPEEVQRALVDEVVRSVEENGEVPSVRALERLAGKLSEQVEEETVSPGKHLKLELRKSEPELVRVTENVTEESFSELPDETPKPYVERDLRTEEEVDRFLEQIRSAEIREAEAGKKQVIRTPEELRSFLERAPRISFPDNVVSCPYCGKILEVDWVARKIRKFSGN